MYTTTFRPEIDGYAFKNSWTPDQQEHQKVKEIIEKALPAAVGVLSPIIAGISPLVIATMGPAILALGPALPFLPIFAPLIAKEMLEGITDKVADGINGFCAGMAFSSLDYYKLNWMLPRGTTENGQPIHKSLGGTDGSDYLRDLIWQRLLDSTLDDGARYIMFMAMNLLFGDYGKDWIKKESQGEMQKLKDKIKNGEPWPVGMITSSASPGDAHVVVAISYEELSIDYYKVGIYNNNNPDTTQYLLVDLRGPEVHISQTPVSKAFCGIFCCSYNFVQPQPALVAQSDLSLTPGVFAGAGKNIVADFTAQYLGFETGLKSHLAVGGINYAYGEELPNTNRILKETEVTSTAPDISFVLYQATVYDMYPKIALFPANGGAPSYKLIPEADGTMQPLRLTVTPRIKWDVVSKRAACYPPFIEGDSVNFKPDLSEVSGIGVTGFLWEISGTISGQSTQQNLLIPVLPQANSKVYVKLTVSLANGTAAYGNSSFVTMDAAFADRYYELCQLSHIFMQPGFIKEHLNPLINPVRGSWFQQKEVQKGINPQVFISKLEGSLKKMQVMMSEKNQEGLFLKKRTKEVNVYTKEADVKM